MIALCYRNIVPYLTQFARSYGLVPFLNWYIQFFGVEKTKMNPLNIIKITTLFEQFDSRPNVISKLPQGSIKCIHYRRKVPSRFWYFEATSILKDIILTWWRSKGIKFVTILAYPLTRKTLYVSQHIERYQLSEDWILSYGDAKSKNFKIRSLRMQILGVCC